MAVAYQVARFGLKPAGFELFDISVPEKPRSISSFEPSGPRRAAAMPCGSSTARRCTCLRDPELKPLNPKDDQVYRIVDVSNPAKPVPSALDLPGTMEGDREPPPERLAPNYDAGFRAHNTTSIRSARPLLPRLPRRRMMVLDIADRSRPAMISRWANSPPTTALPTRAALFARACSCQRRIGAGPRRDWPKLVWLLDARDERHWSASPPCLRRRSTRSKQGRTLRAHNLHENPPVQAPGARGCGARTFFNAGVRAYDVRDPYSPREVACSSRRARRLAPAQSS